MTVDQSERISELEREAMLDPQALCEAAGGDWCLEHFDESTPTRDVLLAVLRERTKDVRELQRRVALLECDLEDMRGNYRSVRDQLAAAKADTERVDAWERMSRGPFLPGVIYDPNDGFVGWRWELTDYQTWREAIDAARAEPPNAA